METTVYLIRHSVRLNMKNNIESYNTTQESLIKSEKIILSVTGERRAEKLSNEKELQNIDVVYASNCVRTLQTAKYLMEKQNLKANLDERLDERRTGKPNDKEYPDWYTRQFQDENFKTEGGESQAEVRERVNEAFQEVVSQNKGKRIAIFAHDYAIMYFLLKWCKLEKVTPNRELKLSFKGKVVFDKRINSPEVFKLTLNDGNEIEEIENIPFDDLEFDDFNK